MDSAEASDGSGRDMYLYTYKNGPNRAVIDLKVANRPSSVPQEELITENIFDLNKSWEHENDDPRYIKNYDNLNAAYDQFTNEYEVERQNGVWQSL